MTAVPEALLGRLAGVDSTSLADVGRGTVRVLPGELRPVRRGLRLLGTAVTVEARDDLMPMLAALRLARPGDVLVVAGSPEQAVAGELFATEALRRGLGGIVIDGFCRDTATLARLDLPVYARGSVPSAPPALGLPVVQMPVRIGAVVVRPGDVVLGDDDGLVAATADELEVLIDAAEDLQRAEVALQRAIAAGDSLFDHLNYDEHLAALKAGRPSRLTFS